MASGELVKLEPREGVRISHALWNWWTGLDGFCRLASLVILLGALARLGAMYAWPLWLDETFTATIASQETLGGFIDWITHELGGPVYYTFMFLWEKIAGDSDFALRLPSQLFSIAALAAILATNTLEKHQKVAWGALLALWPSAHFQAGEARSYALLVLLCVAQLIAFINLLRNPDLKRALVWTGLSGFAILTHFHAAFISLVQGLLYLIWCREKAFATWPAALLLAPVFAWTAILFRFLSLYATPGNNWYNIISWEEIPELMLYLVPFGIFSVPFILAIIFLFWDWSRRGVLDGEFSDPAPKLAALSGFLAATFIIVLGMVTPSFTLRYLVPCVPATLLGVALCFERVRRSSSLFAMVLLGALCVLSIQSTARVTLDSGNRKQILNFQRASEWIMAQGNTSRLVFFWDNPTAEFSDASRLAEVGGYFFRRAHHPLTVIVPRNLGDGANDPYRELHSLAGKDGGSAIIIVSDTAVPGTHAIRYSEHFSRDPHWRCDQYHDQYKTLLGCVPRD